MKDYTFAFKTMDITINTPALLFPAISLIMLAYTNRFPGAGKPGEKFARQIHQRATEASDPQPDKKPALSLKAH